MVVRVQSTPLLELSISGLMKLKPVSRVGDRLRSMSAPFSFPFLFNKYFIILLCIILRRDIYTSHHPVRKSFLLVLDLVPY